MRAGFLIDDLCQRCGGIRRRFTVEGGLLVSEILKRQRCNITSFQQFLTLIPQDCSGNSCLLESLQFA